MGMAGTNISNLPDCVLHCILSFLPSEDVVRTSILAKRWRYFWTFLTVFDLKVPPRRYATLNFPNDIRFPLLKTLNLSRVTFANENLAQQLFSDYCCPVLQDLTLYNCYWLNVRQITIAISTLRILTFHFNYNCIYINNNYDDNFILKVDAVNLVSLTYSSHIIVELLPVNLTSVVDAYINLMIEIPQNALYAADCAFQLLRGLSSIKSLRLTNETLEFLGAKDTLHFLPPFHNLTHLHVLSEEHLYTSETLKDLLLKTPKLEVLQIRTGLDGEIWTLNSMPCCFKSSLKLVCISDFTGEEDEIELVQFLLENATALREIKIFWLTCITSDLEKLDHIKNQLQPSPFSRCVITFQ